MERTILDKKLKEAFEIYNKNWTSSFPDDEQLERSVLLTPAFCQRMEKLVRIQSKPYFLFVRTTTRKVASIVLILLLALSITTFSVKAIREPVFSFIIEVYEKISSVTFQRDGNDGMAKPSITTYYSPIYIPEGFTETNMNKLELYYGIEFQNKDQIIRFAQMVPDNSQIQIDTEGTATSKIIINGFKDICFFNKGNHNIICTTNEYVFYVSGTIEKSELIVVAESIKPEVLVD